MDPGSRFERALLESARADAEPGDVGAAWSRFAAVLGQATAGQATAGQVREAPQADTTPPSAAHLGGSTRAVPAGRMATWVMVGALGGAGITAAASLWFRRPATAVHTMSAAAPSEVAAAPFPAALSGGADEVPARVEPAVRNRGGRSARKAPRSTLPAEVAQIDAARRANASGNHLDAIRIVDEYHARFPAGLLAADADMVALEASAANRDSAEVTRRAAVFLARYPRDPHAARVRRITAEASRPGR